jgi:hypothetical protein
MPVEKPTTRPTTTKSTKPKGKSEAVPSTKINNVHSGVLEATQVPKRPRRTTMVPMTDIQ